MIPKISKITELKENTSTPVIFDGIDQFQFVDFTDLKIQLKNLTLPLFKGKLQIFETE